MAVTVEYRDGTEIQLLPATRTGEDVAVSSWDGQSWSSIRPRSFAEGLTAVNQSQGSAVVPAIKLAKSILASTLGNAGPSGYHVEALALAAFRDYEDRERRKPCLRTSLAAQVAMCYTRSEISRANHSMSTRTLEPRTPRPRQALSRNLGETRSHHDEQSVGR